MSDGRYWHDCGQSLTGIYQPKSRYRVEADQRFIVQDPMNFGVLTYFDFGDLCPSCGEKLTRDTIDQRPPKQAQLF